MKKSKFLKNFTIIDYIIVLLFIFILIFAFIHISSDNDDSKEVSSYDSSTLNKINSNYLNFYKDGKVVKTTVDGYNASSGEKIQMKGTIKWLDDDRGGNVKILIESNGKTYLASLYDEVPNSDIYINKITLETDGEKYSNVTEIKASPKNITKINDLTKGIENNTRYEISTIITTNHQESIKYQEISNILFDTNKRISIKATNTGIQNQITLIKSTSTEINNANNVLGSFTGLTGEITIRIYNCTSEDLNTIEKNFNITNIQKI